MLGALPADAALLSFVRYDRTPRSPTPGAPPPAALRAPARPVASYLAFVLRAGQPAVAVPVGTVQAVDSLVAQWRADIAGAVTTSAAPESARASGAALRRQVWDRVAAHLGDAARVFIVPDGTLGLVPFAALPMGERSYLIERGPVVHYLSAERDIVAHASTSSSPNGLLAIGGPSFNDASMFASRARPRTPVSTTATTTTAAATLRGAAMPCGGLQQITFEPLGGTRQEVRDLSGVWNTGATATMGQAQVLIGRDASETAFKRGAAGSPRAASGDARILPERRLCGGRRWHPWRRWPVLRRPAAPTWQSAAAVRSRAGRRESPIVAAGPDEDDGILTADEVASLDLSGVEWAVLSACDTGVGEIHAGEGVFGLRRAFQVAGVRTVVMSLWSVDDQATRAWMKALYEGRFQRRLSPPTPSTRRASSVLRERRATGLSTHPFYWAAFVAAGDWR